MTLHDEHARRTPYELLFPELERGTELATQAAEEAGARGADVHDPHGFLSLGSVAAVAEGLVGPESEPGARHSYGLLLYHAVHFAAEGCRVHLLSTHAARYLVEGSPGGDAVPLARAGYLQLPQHLFWARMGAEAAPESVDGIFWTVAPDGVLRSVMVIGVRPDRAGLGVVPLPDAPVAHAASWLEADGRGDGTDFASDLPGAELDGLYSLRTAGEALKLVARVFAYVANAEGAVERRAAAERLPDEVRAPPGGAMPSSLPYDRIVLAG